jgi:hypothetical protein
MTDLFGKNRHLAFEKWQAGTNRQGHGIDERYDQSYECRWQRQAQENLGYTHISLFCSLADWAGNITDLLSDTRYDNYNFENSEHCLILARYYTRILMVIAEQLADLQQIAQVMLEINSSQARERISPSDEKNWVGNLQGFVNNVCKHKAERDRIHYCNHHLPLHFADMSNECQYGNPTSLSNVKSENSDAIQYPKLGLLVDRVLTAYEYVDSIVMENEDACRRICDKCDDPNFIWAPE